MRGAGVLGMVVAWLCAVAPAAATHDADVHSPNVRPVATLPLGHGLTDLAFDGDLAVAGRWAFDGGAADGLSVVDVSQPAVPREIARFVCTGGGWDVSLWDGLAFLSVDSFSPTEDGGCDAPPGGSFMGIKIVSLDDPRRPVSVGAVEMPCSGSHANTVVPAGDKVYVYAASLRYPYDLPAAGCDAVIEVPLGDPSKAKVVGSLSGDQVEACHDVAAFLPRKLLVGACQTELRLYDISEPAAPRLLSAIANPAVAFQHSGAFSNDGNTLVMGEENAFYTGGTGACFGGTNSPVQGALWFYDISDPAMPVPRGYHALQRGFETRSPNGSGCSVHDFNVVPTRGDQDVVVTAWYAGGLSAVDFTDPAAPREIAHYQPDMLDPARRSHYWSAYWYRDHVYATNTFETERRSLDVYAIDDPAIGATYRLPRLSPQTQEAPSDSAPAPPVAEEPLAPPAAPANPPSSCRPPAGRVRFRGARRVLRAGLYSGARRVRRLKARRDTVRLAVRGLPAGRYVVRVTYRDRKGRRRVAGRRITVC